MIYFEIEEEYGYHDWIWAYPGAPAEAFADWVAGLRPIGFDTHWLPPEQKAAYEAARNEDGNFGDAATVAFKQTLGVKGTLHRVRYEDHPWSPILVDPEFLFHCHDKPKEDYCDECSKIRVVELVEDLVALRARIPGGELERPFPAITSIKQFAGRGHVHWTDDSYFEVPGVGRIDTHFFCPPGCQTCAGCGEDHVLTRPGRTEFESPRVLIDGLPPKAICCGRLLCQWCASKSQFCSVHTVVDAIGLLEGS